MPSLHQAVARAIASARGVEGVCDCSEEAAAAIGVCLAEAQRAVEAARDQAWVAAGRICNETLTPPAPSMQRAICDTALCEALAVLAALAEEQA